MALQAINEQDILKSLVRKGALTDLCKEFNTSIDVGSPLRNSNADLKRAAGDVHGAVTD